MLLLEPPSTVTLYALGGFAPDVDVVTARFPVSAAQLTAKAAVAVPPGGTITVRDGPFATVQFRATPAGDFSQRDGRANPDRLRRASIYGERVAVGVEIRTRSRGAHREAARQRRTIDREGRGRRAARRDRDRLRRPAAHRAVRRHVGESDRVVAGREPAVGGARTVRRDGAARARAPVYGHGVATGLVIARGGGVHREVARRRRRCRDFESIAGRGGKLARAGREPVAGARPIDAQVRERGDPTRRRD